MKITTHGKEISGVEQWRHAVGIWEPLMGEGLPNG